MYTVEMYLGLIGEGIVRTLAITILSFSMGFMISLIITLTRFLGGKAARRLLGIYIDFFRGTPLLVQLLLIYFGLPNLGLRLNAFTAAVVAIGLNSGAYQAEILRTAIKGIPEEQIMVAESLGMKPSQIQRHVILPQALRNALPGLSNEVIMLLKESSLASVIGVLDLTRAGEYMTAATFRALESYLIVAGIYLLFSYAFSKALRTAEKKYAMAGYERWV